MSDSAPVLRANVAAVAHCPHCDAEVVGAVDRFCCSGCEMAWALVHEAGLERYYERREVPGARPEALEGGWDQVVPVGL
ncbi:MAG: heavy metal translocating P-type ATPase metal-binding domain-containing protein, partial [Myxococcota bacterium]